MVEGVSVETVKSPLEDLPTPTGGSDWADQVEDEETAAVTGGVIGKPTIQYKGEEKTATEYRINPDNGNKEKVVTTYKVERKMVLKSVAARKRLPKFGQSSNDDSGPIKATTQISHEEIPMKFLSTNDNPSAEDDDFKNVTIGDKVISCRYCGSTTHLSAHCTMKEQMEQYKNLSNEMSGQKKSPLDQLGVEKGSYVPPSLRNKTAGGGPMGSSASTMNRSDQNCVRVSNLPDSVTEEDLKELFKPFGTIERIFVAKDRITKVSKGFAFVTYKDKSSAEKAISRVNRHGYDHLILSVEWAQPATARP
jgi:translation initiation factor 3 subunit G